MKKISLNMATDAPLRLDGRTTVTGEFAKAIRLATLRGEMSNRKFDSDANCYIYAGLAPISAGVKALFKKHNLWGE